jgi:hypothetical protein
MPGSCAGCRSGSEHVIGLRNLVFAVAAALALAGSVFAGVGVTWRGKKIDLAAPPADFPGDAKQAADALAGWAGEHGYRLDLDQARGARWCSARAMVPSGSSTRRARWRWSTGSNPHRCGPPVPDNHGSGTAPPPTAPTAACREVGDERAQARHGHVGARRRQEARGPRHVAHAPRRDHAVPRELGEDVDAGAGFRAGRAARRRGRARPAREQGVERRERVRAPRGRARAAAFKYGRQPYWLLQGFAWHAEMELRRGIYCFPYRSGFVWAVEHTGWRARVGGAVARQERGAARRGRDAQARQRSTTQGALNAWGAATFLAREARRAGFAPRAGRAQPALGVRLAQGSGRRELGTHLGLRGAGRRAGARACAPTPATTCPRRSRAGSRRVERGASGASRLQARRRIVSISARGFRPPVRPRLLHAAPAAVPRAHGAPAQARRAVARGLHRVVGLWRLSRAAVDRAHEPRPRAARARLARRHVPRARFPRHRLARPPPDRRALAQARLRGRGHRRFPARPVPLPARLRLSPGRSFRPRVPCGPPGARGLSFPALGSRSIGPRSPLRAREAA